MYSVTLLAQDGTTSLETSRYNDRKFAEQCAASLADYWDASTIFENGMRAKCVLLVGKRTHIIYELKKVA